MHNDYIMKIIDQFSRSLASIISSRKLNKQQESFSQICKASQRYLETDITVLMQLDPTRLLDHFRFQNRLDNERCIFCADLLFELALISVEMGFDDAADRLKSSSLNLYLAAIPEDSQFQVKGYYDKVSSLIQELDHSLLSSDVQSNLQLYQSFLNTKIPIK